MATNIAPPAIEAGVADPHRTLHNELGALPGEHLGRAPDPIVKVTGLCRLEFEKPDLARAERFLVDFGFVVAHSTPDELWMRGRWPGAACLLVRKADRSRFVGPVFRAADRGDVSRLARAFDVGETSVNGVRSVSLRDPVGVPVTVVFGAEELPALPERESIPMNVGPHVARTNSPQRPPRRAAEIERLGHVVLATTRFRETLDWYLDTLGLIVSDFLYLDGQRERGPVMGFLRCDTGSVPTDHHALALLLNPAPGYVHSAYQVADLDQIAAGSEYLRDQGYKHSWGIGRHIQGSQIFDYWRDPDGLMFEHYTDGDLFDASAETGWASMAASRLSQWGPKATRDFLGMGQPATIAATIKALADRGNDLDLPALRGLIKAMSS
jgi:catechol 2,3-dioxygenase-like lactoylglutathione lyase family enzyme